MFTSVRSESFLISSGRFRTGRYKFNDFRTIYHVISIYFNIQLNTIESVFVRNDMIFIRFSY
jgi:hypothetical protein